MLGIASAAVLDNSIVPSGSVSYSSGAGSSGGLMPPPFFPLPFPGGGVLIGGNNGLSILRPQNAPILSFTQQPSIGDGSYSFRSDHLTEQTY